MALLYTNSLIYLIICERSGIGRSSERERSGGWKFRKWCWALSGNVAAPAPLACSVTETIPGSPDYWSKYK